MRLLLQDMDLMVKISMAIEREVDDTRNIWEACIHGTSGRRVLKLSERFGLRD